MSRTLKKLQFQQTPPGPFATTADLGDCNQYLYGLTNTTVLTKLQVKYFMTEHENPNYTELSEYPDLYLLPNGPAGHAYNLTSAAFYYETNSDGTTSYFPKLTEVKDNNTEYWKYAGTFTLNGVTYDKWDKQIKPSSTWVSSGYYVLTTRVVSKICDTKVESAICDGDGLNIADNYASYAASVAYSGSVSDLSNAPVLYEYKISLYNYSGDSQEGYYNNLFCTVYWPDASLVPSGYTTEYYQASNLPQSVIDVLYFIESRVICLKSGEADFPDEPGVSDFTSIVMPVNISTQDVENQIYVGWRDMYDNTSYDAYFSSVKIERLNTICDYGSAS